MQRLILIVAAVALISMSPPLWAQIDVYSANYIQSDQVLSVCRTTMNDLTTKLAYPHGVLTQCKWAGPGTPLSNWIQSSLYTADYACAISVTKVPDGTYVTTGDHYLYLEPTTCYDQNGTQYPRIDPLGYASTWNEPYVGASKTLGYPNLSYCSWGAVGGSPWWELAWTQSSVTTNGLSPSSVALTAGQPWVFHANEWSNWAAGAGTVSPTPQSQVTYTAPAPITSAQTVYLAACNTSNSSDCAYATIYLNPATITISPANPYLVGFPGAALQFYDSQTGTSTPPTWTSSVPNSINASSGTFTVPSNLNITAPTPVTITANIFAVSAQTTLTLLPPVGQIAVTPTSWNSGGQTDNIKITGNGFGSNPRVTFSDPYVSWSPVTNDPNCQLPACIKGTAQIPPYNTQELLAVTVQNTDAAYSGSIGNSSTYTGVTVAAATVSVSISPATIALQETQQQSFVATVNCKTTGNSVCYPPVSQNVNWSVTGIGSINNVGLYTAPSGQAVTGAPTDKVNACSNAGGTQVCGTATVNLQAVTVAVTPNAASLYAGQTQQFLAQVANSSNHNVTWSVTCASNCPNGVGSVNSSGLYTAPMPVTSLQQSVTVKACSQLDTSKCSAATVSLIYAAPPTVSVSTPWLPVQVKYGGTTGPMLYGPVGAPVTITGANFVTQPTVNFRGVTSGSTVNAPITNWTPTSISATVPSGAATGNVVVSVGGQGSNGVAFMVTNGPYNSGNCR